MTGRETDDQRTTGEDPYREWDAAYVLGSLDPGDRRVFEEPHVRRCSSNTRRSPGSSEPRT